MAYIGKTPTVGNFQKCDAISVVNGQAAYTLQVGGSNVSPESPNHILVSLNGILQAPTDSYTVSGATLTFASNLATGDVIDFVILLGNVLDLGTPSDNTVTAAKLNNDIISGQTELAATPADTDEFLVSDAGTIKRIDYSLIKGGLVKISSSSISSGTSTVSFTSGIDSTYDNYVFELVGIHPSADASRLLFSVSADGGSNYNLGLYTAFSQGFNNTSDGGTSLSGESDSDVANATSATLIRNMGNATNEASSCTLKLFNLNDTTYYKNFTSLAGPSHSSGGGSFQVMGGKVQSSSAVNAIQFSVSSGTLDAGTITLYGVLK